MTLTVLQLLQCSPALQSLASQPHRGRVAFRIRKMGLILQPFIQTASVSRDSLFNEQNSFLTGTGARQLKDEYTAAVLNDPLFAETVAVDLEPLTPGDLEDAVISPDQLTWLGPLLAEENSGKTGDK